MAQKTHELWHRKHCAYEHNSQHAQKPSQQNYLNPTNVT